jgi:hypothetical protein
MVRIAVVLPASEIQEVTEKVGAWTMPAISEIQKETEKVGAWAMSSQGSRSESINY